VTPFAGGWITTKARFAREHEGHEVLSFGRVQSSQRFFVGRRTADLSGVTAFFRLPKKSPRFGIGISCLWGFVESL